MGRVFNLCMSEPSAIDTDAVQSLKRELGEKRCRAVVDTVIFEITDALCRIERLVGLQAHDELPEYLTKLRELSGQVGLICMIDVVNDLLDTVRAKDDVSTAAVAARLVRIGEDSLFSLIEFTDRSIV